MDFELANGLLDIVARADQRGHDHQCPLLGGHAILELVADEPRRLEEQSDDSVEEAERTLARRHGKQHQQQGDRCVGQADRLQRGADRHHQQHRQQKHRNDDAGPAGVPKGAVEHPAEGRAIADRLFQFLAARADQEKTDIVALVRGDAAIRARRPVPAHLGGLLGDLEFGQVGAARQILDRCAVLVARREIQEREIGALAQQRIDAADALEPLGPVDVVDEPEAPDDVAGRDVARRQRVVLADDDFLGVRAGLLQLLFKPDKGFSGILRAVAQPVEELRGKGRVARMRRVVRQDGLLVVAVARGEHAIGDIVGDLAQSARPVHPDRDATQVFDQDETQERRQRPQFADLQRLDRLETLDNRPEIPRRYGAVRMRDVDPGQRQRARHRLAVWQGQRRQLAIEAARQIALDLEDRLFDEVVVVEQPLRGRRDHVAARLRGIGRAVDREDFGGVFADASLEVESLDVVKGNDLVSCKAFAERPKPVFMQEVCSYWLLRCSREKMCRLLQPLGIGLNIHTKIRSGADRRVTATARSA